MLGTGVEPARRCQQEILSPTNPKNSYKELQATN